MQGADKGWVHWQGRPLIEHVLQRLHDQTVSAREVIISANRNLPEYAATGAQVVMDHRQGYFGPLAGIEAGLQKVRSDWVLVVACDMPCLPLDLAHRLLRVAQASVPDVKPVAVKVLEQIQPLCLMLPRSIGSSISKHLDAGQHKVQTWLTDTGAGFVRFDLQSEFANINSIGEHFGGSLS